VIVSMWRFKIETRTPCDSVFDEPTLLNRPFGDAIGGLSEIKTPSSGRRHHRLYAYQCTAHRLRVLVAT
jgi:hypothetical protein